MRVKEVPATSKETSVVVIGEADKKYIQSAFYAERDSFQEEILAAAKKSNVDKFEMYAQILFVQHLSDRYEYAKSKQAKVLRGALGVLIASGMSEEEGMKRLGLGE